MYIALIALICDYCVLCCLICDYLLIWCITYVHQNRLGLDANTSKIDKSALRRCLDISYEQKSNESSIIRHKASAANRSAPLLSQSPLSPLSLPQIALISSRRIKRNEKKRNLLKLKRRLALSSSLTKRRFVNMDKIRGTHQMPLTI